MIKSTWTPQIFLETSSICDPNTSWLSVNQPTLLSGRLYRELHGPTPFQGSFCIEFQDFLKIYFWTEVLKSSMTFNFWSPSRYPQCHITIQSYRDQTLPFYFVRQILKQILNRILNLSALFHWSKYMFIIHILANNKQYLNSSWQILIGTYTCISCHT